MINEKKVVGKTEEKGNSKKGSGKAPFKTNRRGEKRDKFGGSNDKPFVGPNDYTWRTGKELLALSAASLPFGNPIGLPNNVNPGASSTKTITVPGIMAVVTELTAGSASNYNSPCNLAARQLYSIMRKSNSGAKNYDVTDMMVYLLAYAQALGFLGWLERLYHTVTAFSSTNRYTPLALIKIQGVDAVDLKDHQAELAFLISWFGNGLKSLNVPNLTYYKACREAFSHYYTDDENPKHQFYLYTPGRFGIFDPAHTGGGAIVYSQQIYDGGSSKTFAQIRSLAHGVLDVLLSDQDIGIISGDIAKAFPDLYEPVSFTRDEVLTPIYSIEILQQIHNCVLGPSYIGSYTQNAGSTGTGPYLQHNIGGTIPAIGVTYFQGLRLDAFSKDPKPEEVINCTVLQVTRTNHSASTTLMFDLYYPYAIAIVRDPTAAAIETYGEDDGFGQQFVDWPAMTNLDQYDIAYITAFDWHPFVSVGSPNAGGTAMEAGYLIGEIRNIRWFHTEIADNIHTCSMLSMFDFNSIS